MGLLTQNATDPDYTGNKGVVLKNNSKKPIERLMGEAIAQLLFIRIAMPTLIQVTAWLRHNVVKMALGPMMLTETRICEQFQKGLQILLDTIDDAMILYTQNIQVVNYFEVSTGFVNVIIMYETSGGKVSEIRSLG